MTPETVNVEGIDLQVFVGGRALQLLPSKGATFFYSFSGCAIREPAWRMRGKRRELHDRKHQKPG